MTGTCLCLLNTAADLADRPDADTILRLYVARVCNNSTCYSNSVLNPFRIWTRLKVTDTKR